MAKPTTHGTDLMPAADREALLIELGARVKARRHRRALTLSDVARTSRLSVAYLSLIERGERNPPYTTLVALATALGISSRSLCG